MSGIKNVFGGAAFWVKDQGLAEPTALQQVFNALEQGDVHTIDTASLYADSEKVLGEAQAGKRFTIDTKAKNGFQPGGGSQEKVTADIKNSEALLGTKVDVLYLHAPDKDTPIAETLTAVNEAYKSGFFKRLGLSNFTAAAVEEAYNISKERGWVLPTVYQGNYSPIARKQETVLFPTLRKLNISFYAYSPLAGGFLSKTKEQLLSGGQGRWEKGTMLGDLYHTLYSKPALLDGLTEWEGIAKEEGVSKAELAYRWVKYNSPLKPEHGDAIIIGASSLQQLEETLGALKKGPLSESAVKSIDAFWKKVESDAPLDNYHQ